MRRETNTHQPAHQGAKPERRAGTDMTNYPLQSFLSLPPFSSPPPPLPECVCVFMKVFLKYVDMCACAGKSGGPELALFPHNFPSYLLR